MTPLEKVEALYQELVNDYHEGEQREVRAAAKLLMVGLEQLQKNGGFAWQQLLEEYVIMLKQDPERFQSMLNANRGEHKRPMPTLQ